MIGKIWIVYNLSHHKKRMKKSPNRIMPKWLNPAFSLVEMLMALLVASLLMSALAPVITRHTKADEISVFSGNPLAEKKVCAYINDTFEDIKADDCIVPDDAYYGSAIIVSGGGGGAGAINGVESTSKNANFGVFNGSVNTTDANSYTISTRTFNQYVSSMRILMVGGGAGGGGGNYKEMFIPSEKSCSALLGKDTVGKSNYAVFEPTSKLCVTKYNQVSNPSDYTSHVTKSWDDAKCTSNYKHSPYCNTEQGQMAYDYSGCNRPICTHRGAEVACKKLSELTGATWELPPYVKLQKWGVSAKALAICAQTASFTELTYCGTPNSTATEYYIYSGMCSEFGPDLCNFRTGASRIWAKEIAASNTNYYRCYYDGTNILLGGSSNSGSLNSVRCVRDAEYGLNTGGGGGAGGHMRFDVPNDVLKYATRNNREGIIKIYVGAGGKGSAKQSIAQGGSGSPTRVEIYSYDNTVNPIWAIQISGGTTGGNGASLTSGGGGGAGTSSGSGLYCRYLHKSIAGGNYDTEVDIACNTIPLAGSAFGAGWSGISGKDGVENKGQGGAAAWETGRQDYTPVNESGMRGSGGGGGTRDINEDGVVTCNDGGNGGAGVVEITYTTKSPGIGGSGGGAGGLLHIVNFETAPKSKIEIQAGKRGKGGSSGARGMDGGESYIKVGTKTYSVPGGKGAEAGTPGVPPVDNVSNATMPSTGKAGEGSKITSTTGTKFNGENGTKGIAPDALNFSQSKGGNGGVNPKIALFSDIPCGGLSTVPIQGAACNRTSNIPTPLTRTLTKDDFNSAFKSTYAAGASGGGGGGWNDNLNEAVSAASGADGLGGFVFVYFGPW